MTRSYPVEPDVQGRNVTPAKPRRANPAWFALLAVAWVLGWAADRAMRREGGYR